MGLLNGNKLKNVARVLVSMLVVTTALVLLCSVAFADEGASGGSGSNAAVESGAVAPAENTGNFNAPGTYNVDDVAFINGLIDNNGLQATLAPEDGSSIPVDWQGMSRWTEDATNKRVTYFHISIGPFIGTVFPDMSKLTSLEELVVGGLGFTTFTNLPPNLLVLECSSNNLTALPALPETLVELRAAANELTELPELPSTLLELHVFANHLSGVDLTGIDCELYGYDQTLAYTLVGNSEDGWSIPISLNNPILEGFTDGISYENGVLTSTDDSITTILFAVETGNVDGSDLSGTITLTYENEQVTPPPSTEEPADEDASEQATSMPATGDEAFAFLPGLAAVLSLGMGLVAFSTRRKSSKQQ